MDKLQPNYFTIYRPTEEVLIKIKKSKFLSYAYPVQNEEQCNRLLALLRDKHKNANHVCYAYRLKKNEKHKYSDDGEPKNTAGFPIYGQLLSKELQNTLIAVVRYFGGVKLGSGGLVQAYKQSASAAIENTQIIPLIEFCNAEVQCRIKDYDRVFHIISTFKAQILEKKISQSCELKVRVQENKFEALRENLTQLYPTKTILLLD
tara:strand:- start:5530 stop:6144 length:615 start_codon:yes stop_codon:yes gene_type:complete